MAATDSRQLQLQISASSELLIRNLRQADNAVAQFQRGTDARLQTIEGQFERLGRLREVAGGIGQSLTAAISVGSIAAAGAGYLRLADTAKQLHAQLVLATGQFGSLGQAQADAERIAATTRIGLEASTSLYSTFLRTAEPLGRTQADAALASETFAKALKLGGATAETASQATLQFSQALASGVLRGDEFNSIAEASPRVLRLLADAMGLPQGQLRALAAEGKLTADVLYDALTNTKVTAGLNKEFEQLPTTMGEAMTLVRDEAVKVAGAFDRGSQLSGAISSLVLDGVDGFGSMGDAAEEFGIEARAVFSGLGGLFDPIKANGDAVFDALGVRIRGVREQIQSLLDSYDRVANFDANIENAIKRAANRAIDRAGGGKHFELTALADAGGRFRRESGQSEARSRELATASRLDERFGGVEGLRRFTSDPGRYTIFGTARAGAPRPTPASTGGGRSTRSRRTVGRTRPAVAEPFALKTTDFPELYDSVRQQEALDRAARDARDRVLAIFGEGDPLAAMVEGYNNGQQARADLFGPKQLGPLEEYREQMRAATADMNLALEGVAVNGLDLLQNSLLDVIDGTSSLGDAFSDMARSIIADLARIAIQKAIVAAIGTAGKFFGIPLKDGGPVLRRAGGGPIFGPGGPRDDRVPALLSIGEFVVNAAAYARHPELVEAINANRIPRFAAGGAVSAPRLPRLSSATSGRDGAVLVRLALSDDLHATIANKARDVSVEVIRSAAPELVQASTNNTINELRKQTL